MKVSASRLGATYVLARNDLWAQKFEIDKVTGAISILAEH